jgi:hypothetical protein
MRGTHAVPHGFCGNWWSDILIYVFKLYKRRSVRPETLVYYQLDRRSGNRQASTKQYRWRNSNFLASQCPLHECIKEILDARQRQYRVVTNLRTEGTNDFPFPRCSLSAVDCQLSASSSPLTPLLSPLARPTSNMPVFYLLSNRGSPGPGHTIWSNRSASLIASARSKHMLMLEEVALDDLLPVTSHQLLPPVTNHHSPVTLPTHCAPAPLMRESPHCWTWKHPAASRCLIPRADKGWGNPHDALAQPSSASRPQVALRRWGRKADRVRLGQRTLVG